MKIDIELIKKIRQATQAKMQDCKNALTEAEGDFDKALEILQKLVKNRAAKFVDRVASEGRLISYQQDNCISLIELTCQSDFVSRGDDFVDFATSIVKVACENKVDSIEDLEKLSIDGVAIQDALASLSGTIGEKIVIRKLISINNDKSKAIYIHNNHKLASIVTLDEGSDSVARDIAMHVTAFNPAYKDSNSIPKDIIDKEKAKYLEEMAGSNKPQNILDKIIDGKMQKLFFAETCLVNQQFVKDNNITVSQYLEQSKAKLDNFIRVELGAGIEKKSEDFAAEVQKQIDSANK